MPHIETYTIKGHQYRYSVTNYRIGKKVKHRKKYIGPIKRINKCELMGRKPRLKIRPLTEEEMKKIIVFSKSSNSFEKDRARILLHSCGGKTVRAIANDTGFHRPKIEKIIKQFNNIGFKIFIRGKSPGKPRRITKEQRALIIQFLNTHPEKLGLHFNNWSLNKLKDYANNQGIKISSSQVRRIIKTDNLKYKKKVPWLYSNDPNFAKKNLL
jgi:transposase